METLEVPSRVYSSITRVASPVESCFFPETEPPSAVWPRLSCHPSAVAAVTAASRPTRALSASVKDEDPRNSRAVRLPQLGLLVAREARLERPAGRRERGHRLAPQSSQLRRVRSRAAPERIVDRPIERSDADHDARDDEQEDEAEDSQPPPRRARVMVGALRLDDHAPSASGGSQPGDTPGGRGRSPALRCRSSATDGVPLPPMRRALNGSLRLPRTRCRGLLSNHRTSRFPARR